MIWKRRRGDADVVEPGGPRPDDVSEVDFIDVRQLVASYSVEELAESAEQYFARLDSWDYQLAKPFYAAGEAAELLGGVSALLDGLELAPAHTVLDFGAGGGWTSWMLSQLGCHVVVCDVSETALAIARERYRRLPMAGTTYPPDFQQFDGHDIALGDATVDRISCNDAFHHVANPEKVLAEFVRILRPGGVCVLIEPGPNHSRSPQSQFEMRNFRVVERDIIPEEVASQAKAAGFAAVEIGVLGGLPRFVPSESFMSAIAPESQLPGEMVRAHAHNRMVIRLRKAGATPSDSRTRSGLQCQIDAAVTDGTLVARVANTGEALWLQHGSVGRVNLGIHLYDQRGQLLDFDFIHLYLTDSDSPVPPGATVELRAKLPDVVRGHRLEIDLVSEGVCWFAESGSSPVVLTV